MVDMYFPKFLRELSDRNLRAQEYEVGRVILRYSSSAPHLIPLVAAVSANDSVLLLLHRTRREYRE